MPKFCVVCGKSEERHTPTCNLSPAEVERVTHMAALPAKTPCPVGACAHDTRFHEAIGTAPACIVPGCGCRGQAS